MLLGDMTPEEKRQLLVELLRDQEYGPSSSGVQPPSKSAQGGGPSPAMAMQFMPQSGGAAGGGASGGGASGGGMAAAAGPAALAAAIIANETYQNKSGNRPADFGDHMKELATGEVLERDVSRYLGDSELAQHMGRMGNPKGMYKNVKKSLKPWEWF